MIMMFPNSFRFSLFLLFVAASGQFVDLSVCDKQWAPERISQAIVTFIIPSIGRISLPRTLHSVLGQTNPRWLALILFDGIVSSSLYLNSSSSFRLPIFYHDLDQDILDDSRICIVHLPPVKRKANCGAEKRNAALSLISTEWTGFVDDDDLLDAQYIKYLIEHKREYPAAQCILFRMCQTEKSFTTLFPRFDSHTFFRQEVGISFAVRTSLFLHHGYVFQASNWEDFLFLDNLRKNKIPIVLSRHLAYYVRGTNSSECMRQSHLTKTIFLQNDSSNLFLRSSSRLSSQKQQKELQNAKLYECFHRGHGPQQPRFFFTEHESVFFQENINGLQQSLRRSLENGCHGHWLNMPNVSIHVMFDARTAPQSSFYIQIQLEQIRSRHFTRSYISKLRHATQIWDFRGQWKDYLLLYNIATPVYFIPTMLMQDTDTPAYSCANHMHLERNAPNDINELDLQGEVYPSHSKRYGRDRYPWDTEVRYLVDSLQEHSSLLENHSPYEPFLSHKQHDKEKKTPASVTPGAIFWLYRHGYYHLCRITCDTNSTYVNDTRHHVKAEYVRSEASECVSSMNKRDTSDYCWFRNNPTDETAMHHIYRGSAHGSVKDTGHSLCTRLLSFNTDETQRDTHSIDVLQFGKMRGSAHNRREEVCDLLTADDTVSVACVECVFGPLRDALVCRARVVLISHYGDTSVLETHRLDPLLLSGRFVIFETSSATNETQRVSPLVETLYLRHIKLLPGVAVSRTTTTQGLVQETKRFLRKYRKVEKEEEIETQRDTQVTHGTQSVLRDTFSSETQSLLRHTHHSSILATQLRHTQQHNIAFARHMRNTLDPLCFALSQLQVQLQLQHEQQQLLTTHHYDTSYHFTRKTKRFHQNKLQKAFHLYETEHVVVAPPRNPSLVWMTLTLLFFLYMVVKFAMFYRFV